MLRNITKHTAEKNQLKHASICYQWLFGLFKVPSNGKTHRFLKEATKTRKYNSTNVYLKSIVISIGIRCSKIGKARTESGEILYNKYIKIHKVV